MGWRGEGERGSVGARSDEGSAGRERRLGSAWFFMHAGKQDPYCLLTIKEDGQTFRSRTKTDAGKNPVSPRGEGREQRKAKRGEV